MFQIAGGILLATALLAAGYVLVQLAGIAFHIIWHGFLGRPTRAEREQRAWELSRVEVTEDNKRKSLAHYLGLSS